MVKGTGDGPARMESCGVQRQVPPASYSVATIAPENTTGPVGAEVGAPPFGSRLIASVA